MIPAFTEGGAAFNEDRTHRFRLWRAWAPEKPRLAWLMMNPSTADETSLDPTVRRCVGFAHEWGFGGIEVFNVATLRTPSPSVLVMTHNLGIDVFEREARDAAIREVLPTIGRVVVAWGSCSLVCAEAPSVARVFALGGVEVVALGRTKEGHPRHPLYVRGDTLPEAWPLTSN